MSKHPRYHIVIDCNGDSTKAFMFVDNQCVKISQAKRNPKDKFSLRIGAETAFNRLWEKKEKEEKPKPFKVGDRVVCEKESTNIYIRNAHGTVRVVRDDGLIGVEFDDQFPMGHRLNPFNPTAKHGHGWWCFPGTLKREGK